MKRFTLISTTVVCCLVVAVPAAAAQYFYDDFEDGDMSDWTDLQLQVRPFSSIAYGHYGWASRGEDAIGTKEARAEIPLTDTNLGDTVYLSFDFMHTGGWLGGGGMGYKSTKVFMVVGEGPNAGRGYGIEVSLDKNSPYLGTVGIITTQDGGMTVGGSPVGGVPGGEVNWQGDTGFSERTVELVWDRVAATMDVYLEGSLINSVLLDLVQNDLAHDITKIVSAPRNTYYAWPGWMSTDNIYLGDVSNPNVEPEVVEGDSDGNLKVDIVDLTAVAANWSTLSPGTKDWTQGDFNYDWLVDIVDLTALAANWSFAGSPPPVPEPTTMALFGLAGLAMLRRKR